MGKAAAIYEELRVDIRDPEITHCYFLVRAEGDCPLGVQGWHHKAFPASVDARAILGQIACGEEDPLQWPHRNP
jgi:hypothetical protein